MDSTKPSILILLGGLWHDFEGFADSARALFAGQGYRVEATYNLDSLQWLERAGFDLVLSYTSLSEHRPGMDDRSPEGLSETQVSGLLEWLQKGGGLLGVHCATVTGKSDARLEKLLGGAFVSHPEPFSFTVMPLSGEHPITAKVPAFEIHDEFYLQKYDPSVQVHMAATYQERIHPMVWSRLEGRGKVAVIAPGHFPAVWAHATYRQLLLQSAGWLVNKTSGNQP